MLTIHAMVLRALLEAGVVVCRRCCACRGTVEVEIINRSPAKHQPVPGEPEAGAQAEKGGRRHEIELPS